ncbi:MAG: hypothetical protein GWO81_01900 [Verrucomicrobia bacterium]|nr:hypothetical protein [Verrucomicrobiota bacterium]
MKHKIFILTSLLALGGVLNAQSIFNGYAYVSDTTAGTNSTWYNLSGSGQSTSFQGANLGTFSNALWLGGQTGFDSVGNGVNFIEMGYSITGTATANGTIAYAFQSFSAPNDQQGTDVNGANTSDISTNLISAHSLTAGSYNISIYVQGAPNNGSSIYDSNGGSNYNAAFTVVPETSTYALFAGLGVLAFVLTKRLKK